ncbi:hypothetical protein [Singulisphaera sp. PoT]|uniref:hypothetical protein n=1 Tax=Singulisphaera sp. PoT TaxID=3411797 RepID=UPI003BF5D911
MSTVIADFSNIKTIAAAAGLQWWKVSTLIEEHRIPVRKTGRITMVTPEGLTRLVPILKAFPGVSEDFVRDN